MSNVYITQGWHKRGGEVALRNLLLMDETLSNSTILNMSDREYNLESIKETCINVETSINLLQAIKLFKLIQSMNKKRCKFYYVNGNIVLIALIFFAVDILFKNKVKLVIWEHCFPSKHWDGGNIIKNKIIETSYKFLIKLSSEVIVPSDIIKNELRSYNKTINIFRNPLIISTKIDQDIVSVFDLNHINVIYVGAFSKEKNPMHFIKLMDKLINENENVRGFLVGEGILKDELENSIINLKLEDLITIMDWTENIHAIVNRCNIVIVTSKFETYCNVIAESLALGCVVFSTEWEGVKNIYGDNIFYLTSNLDNDVKLILSKIHSRKFCLINGETVMINNNK
jgi:glycosyltransferase involved in cell wall biosynthesis